MDIALPLDFKEFLYVSDSLGGLLLVKKSAVHKPVDEIPIAVEGKPAKIGREREALPHAHVIEVTLKHPGT
jgi:hypothetical protein